MPTANGAVWVPVQLGVIMGVEVDESWGYDEPTGINHFRGVAAVQPADFGNLTVLDAQIGFVAGDPRSIDDRAASSREVIAMSHEIIARAGRLLDATVFQPR